MKALKRYTNLKGWFTINTLDLHVTSEMEKAMQSSHGIGYSEYSRNLDLRIEVEKERDREHVKCNKMVQDLQRKIHG
ncbi:hypothetical protein SAMN05878482_103166 [Peribacillus simplex]|uniref:Uncharacterized protein n=1 Tax=Peribacillus simplex TaxID=1478 RepID=A0A9X8R902_9BACI|nr:hypothetical protein [Peribacillus simplex]SIR26703.1 hypothetical protein SAMN05878482_103166 [Peribacillus simplex]